MRRILTESGDKHPVFVVNAMLLIPKVGIRPNLEEVQEVLVSAGKNITSVAKGVGQWTGGRPPVSTGLFRYFLAFAKQNDRNRFRLKSFETSSGRTSHLFRSYISVSELSILILTGFSGNGLICWTVFKTTPER